MKQPFLVLVSLGIAACATPGAEPDQREIVQGSEAVPEAQSVQVTEGGSGDLYAQDTSPEQTGVVEAPKVAETPPEMIPGRPDPEPAVVCEREVPTGSILPVTVCRDKAAYALKQDADQRLIDDIKRNTANGASRL